MLTKIFYDWFGLNQEWFFLIYGKAITELRMALPVLDQLGEYKNFPYFIGFALVMFLLKFLKRYAFGHTGSHSVFRNNIAWCIAFLLGFAFMAGTVWFLKDWFGIPRPYILMPADVSLLYGTAQANESNLGFPSGHAAFTAFWVAMFWPQCWPVLRLALAWVLIAMCWSRVAIGMHFPADVFYGALIGWLAAVITTKLTKRVLKLWKRPFSA